MGGGDVNHTCDVLEHPFPRVIHVMTNDDQAETAYIRELVKFVLERGLTSHDPEADAKTRAVPSAE